MSHALQQPPTPNNNGLPAASIAPAKSVDGGNVSDRLEMIRHASEGWKKRIEQSDAGQFTVAGRLASKPPVQLPFVRGQATGVPPKALLRSRQPPVGLAKSASMMVSVLPSLLAENKHQANNNNINNNNNSSNANATRNENGNGVGSVALLRSISVPAAASASADGEETANAAADILNLNGSQPNASTTGGSKVSVHRADDDETFASFFVSRRTTVTTTTDATEAGVQIEDFDAVLRSTQRLVQKRTVQGPKKNRRSAANPLKALAMRDDLRNEYVEIRSGIADKELRRLKMESIGHSVSHHLAAEALAGLAATEDFSAVSLRSSALPLPQQQHWLPHRPTMLLHIKGRQHVQTRLVAPTYRSINRGDCFILITDSRHLYRFVGQFANVIERTRSRAICAAILEHHDLGFVGTQRTEHIVTDGKAADVGRHQADFWRLLGRHDAAAQPIAEAGHADEDDLFESCLTQTNMIYEYVSASDGDDADEDGGGDALVPLDAGWGRAPSVDLLRPERVLVFHFGAEVYVWTGRTAAAEAKRAAMRIAQEMFADRRPDYAAWGVAVSPVDWSERAGQRPATCGDAEVKEAGAMPDWSLVARCTQSGETVLFREKFIDWPEELDGIRDDHRGGGHIGRLAVRRPSSSGASMRPLNGAQLWAGEPFEDPNLVLESTNLGRGHCYYDADTMRHYDVRTQSVRKWSAASAAAAAVTDDDDDAASAQPSTPSDAHFYASDSYTVRWLYRVAVSVRELGGQAMSRYPTTEGRDRCVYFCWHGRTATAAERGAGALLTVELDREKGAQVRVAQGDESAAFVRLFGVMYVHRGGRADRADDAGDGWRLYGVQYGMVGDDAGGGDVDLREVMVTEVRCEPQQLRSRASMLVVNRRTGALLVCHGCAAEERMRRVAERVAERMAAERPAELFDGGVDGVRVEVLPEGGESPVFWRALGAGHGDETAERRIEVYGSRWLAAETSATSGLTTPRLFHISSANGHMEAVELLSAFRVKDQTMAFPFSQYQLYGARQPSIFMVDNGDKLWIWQGWWPKEDATDRETDPTDVDPDSANMTDNRAGEMRWQAERRAAMETSLSYWSAKHKRRHSSTDSAASPVPVDVGGVDETDTELVERMPLGSIVWAGLEPVEFIAMFPEWERRNDVARINVADGRSEVPVAIVDGLAQLAQREHSLAVLLARPLPEGCDPTRLEFYLADKDFVPALGVERHQFERMPLWKQTELKKSRGLF